MTDEWSIEEVEELNRLPHEERLKRRLPPKEKPEEEES